MRRLWLVVAVLLIACQGITALTSVSLVNSLPSSTLSPSATPEATPTPLPNASPTPTTYGGFTVRLHPDGPLYIGDQASFEIISPEGFDLEGKSVLVNVIGESTHNLGSSGFEPFGIGERMQATFRWIWDTSDLKAGDYHIDFTIQPEGLTWTELVHLYPAAQVPSPEPLAHWRTAITDCCQIHYITGTEAARDLTQILEFVVEQAEDAVQRMGVDFSDPLPVTILPRVLGHGGFAADEIYVSYLYRNYAGNDLSQVLHHEMVHILDRRLGGELRPPLLVEGFAIYLSGGHFKKEPLMQRAAALFELGWYLPLTELADSFYTSQHEIGYLEGGALVQYLVNAYGWEEFNDFYRDIHPQPSGSQSEALDKALKSHFGLSLAQLEARFKTKLHRQQINPDMYDDLRLTVEFYETVRRYQQMLDPSAFFLSAWLPDGEEMRQREIVADYLRHPATADNLMIEDLLVTVDEELRAGNYTEAEKALQMVNKTLDLKADNVLVGASIPIPLDLADIQSE
jgi:hypothetical protein